MDFAFKKTQRDKRFLISICLFLFALSAVPRLVYNHAVLEQVPQFSHQLQSSVNSGYLTPDSPGYINPAMSLLEGDYGRAVSLSRPIVYPFFLALCGLDPTAILNIQSLLLTIVPICSFLVVLLITQHKGVSFLAGVISSLSPTGIVLGSMVMSDALFSVFFSITFTVLVYGSRYRSMTLIVISSFIAGTATLIKPILILWPIFSVILYVSFQTVSRIKECYLEPKSFCCKNWKAIIVLITIPMIMMTLWANVNHKYNKMFVVSTIGPKTIRLYLLTKVEVWEEYGHHPTYMQIKEKQNYLRNYYATLSTEKRMEEIRIENIEIAKKFPLRTAYFWLNNSINNYVSSWTYFSHQLPSVNEKILRTLGTVESFDRWIKAITLIFIVIVPLVLFLTLRSRNKKLFFENVVIFVALYLSIFYIVGLSGVTFWTGSRIVYPAEFLIISSMVVLCHYCCLIPKLSDSSISHL
jgi:hypothetical protein